MTGKNDMPASENSREAEEMRTLLNFLSRRAKENIIKGIAMFEAGYRTSYLDGMNSLKDRNNFAKEPDAV